MKQLILLASMLSIAYIGKAQTKNFIDQPYIEVSGKADTLVTPDEIYIRIILSEKDTRDRVSIEDLEQKMVAALKGLELNTEKDLTTSDMTSNFKYYILKSKDVIKTKYYSLKVTDAMMASQVFTKLEDAGISNSSIERVEYSALNLLKNKMRTKAITDAKEKAVAMTAPINQTIGAAIYIADASDLDQQLQGRAAGLQIRGYNSDNMFLKEVKMPEIEFEKIKVTANVNVKFILK